MDASSAPAATRAPVEHLTNGHDTHCSPEIAERGQQHSTSQPSSTGQAVSTAVQHCNGTAVEVTPVTSTQTCNMAAAEVAGHSGDSTAAAHLAQQGSCSTVVDGSHSRKPGLLRGVGRVLLRLAVAGIQLVVAIEVAKFGLSRLRLARYMGRRERWCINTSDDIGFTSSLEEDDDVGTSTDLADAVLDYLAEGQDSKELRGLTQQQVARGMRKVQAEDLQDLGFENEAATAMLQQLQASADRLDPTGASSRQATRADKATANTSGPSVSRSTDSEGSEAMASVLSKQQDTDSASKAPPS